MSNVKCQMNIYRAYLRCITIISAVSELLLKCLSSMVNPIVAEHIYMMP